MRYEIKSPSFREGEPSVVVRMIVIPDERVAFSKGGLAQHAKAVAAAGRYGDDMFVHMNKDEFELLKSMWGEPTYHPETGMPEYFSLKSLIPIIGAALMFTGVGSGLGATMLGGSLGTGVGASMAAGALGNAIIGGATAGLSGGDWKRGALLGGAGGALSGYMSGAGAAAKGTDIVAPHGTALTETAGPASAYGTQTGLAGNGGTLAADTSVAAAAPTASTSVGGMQFGDFANMGTAGAAGATAPTTTSSLAGLAPATGALSSVAPAAAGASQSTGILSKLMGSAGSGASGAAGSTGSGMNGLLQAGMSYAKQHPYISAMLASSLFGPSENGQQPGAPAQSSDPNFSMHLPQLTFNRTRNSASGPVTYTYGQQANNQPFYLDNSLASMVPQAPPVGLASGGRIDVNNDTLAGMGIDPQYLLDHKFVPTRAGIRTLHQDQNGYYTVPDQLTWSADGKPVPASLADQQPVQLPPATYTPTTPVVSGTPQNQGGTSQSLPPQLGNAYNTNQYDIAVPGTVFKSRYGNYKLPGLAHGGSAVAGPGTGRTDEIPARLSDGEYVMDAETVAMLGDGSTKAGAARLDQMRENLRKHKGKALARGQISPNAKNPEQYMQGNG